MERGPPLNGRHAPRDQPVHGSLDRLIAWHVADPPDDVERWRNNLIELLQGSRNPFIDYPEIVRLLGLE